MSRFIFSTIIVSVSLFSCNEIILDDKQQDVVTESQQNNTNAISKELIKVLKSHIDYDNKDNLEEEGVVGDVYIINFSKRKNDCYITIINSLVYDSSDIEGYLNFQNKLIAFYNIENECSIDLVDSSKLIDDIPRDFFDERSDYAKYYLYEGLSIEYRIEKKEDKLNLVYNRRL